MNVQLVYFATKLVFYSAIAVFTYTCCVFMFFLMLKLKDYICEQAEKRKRQRKEKRF